MISGELECRALAPGDIAGLLAAYQEATALADELRTALAACGLDDDAVSVVPSLSQDGAPLLCVGLTGPAAARLADLLAGEPPRHGVPTHPPSGQAA